MTLFLAGVAAFVGLHHIWFWVERPKERVHLWMAALGAGTLTYLPGYHFQMSSHDPALAILGAQLQWTGGTMLIVVLLGLVNRFVGRAAGQAVFRAAAAIGGAYIFCVWFTETVVRHEAVRRVTVTGERYWGVGRGPLMFVFVPFMLGAAAYCIAVLARAREMDRFERRLLLVAFSFYLAVGINEVLFALRLIQTVRLFPPAFALLSVAFSVLLARRFNALARENEHLLTETRAQAQVLEARNAELDAFAYSVSHDLKAPLVAIEGMVDLLREPGDAPLDARVERGLGRMQTNVLRMKRLINDLLSYSRVGHGAHRPAALPVHDVVDVVIDEFADAIRERGMTITRPTPATVWATQTHLEQVFRNLIGNAVKFVGDAAAPAIEVTCVERGAMVECAVRDNGIGIDPAYHARLFEMFHRLDDSIEGTGVGLALVKKIVEYNGGAVWVESEKGCGATFRFTWPRAFEPATTPAAAV